MFIVSVYDLNNGKELIRKTFTEWGKDVVNYYYHALNPFISQNKLVDALCYTESEIIMGFGTILKY